LEKKNLSRIEFEALLQKAELTKKQLSDSIGVAYSTITNWGTKVAPVPKWVDSWIENYIKAQKYDTVHELLMGTEKQ
jgi:Trp operon repressor